ncbi:hypothetical protein N476_16195 [Pseudoalteromonas luteoviolacea H33]|uniref:TonB-dependent receptor-like beta-barrel domain-containing protein n=2 Tax=Pseudoalteromonas luteoviolacea TaxID=43657 RepID=A0A161Y506_9GAMM|nr:hypothetical protein N476_16195 [Pseudoalteromonas luteoviolacea H33]KZN77965.1 hypothetical protein N477_11270 [Pseudoalteromonas luteoviolacea H33-S]
MSTLSMMFLVPELNAEEAPPLESQVFDRVFFEQYHPQTALDMIYRLPGFSFQNTSSARGFGANVGNVLINGARPVVKSEKLSNVLNRLPAASVQQIRIYRGSQIPPVAAGNTVVADVILLDVETSGNVQGELVQFHDGSIKPKVALQLTTSLLGREASVGIQANNTPGYRTALITQRDEQKKAIAKSSEVLDESTKEFKLTAQLSQIGTDTETMLTSKVSREKYLGETVRYDDMQPSNEALYLIRELEVENTTDIAELGIDWLVKRGSHRWQNIAIWVIEDKTFANTDVFFPTALAHSTWHQNELKTELILRSSIELSPIGRFTPQFGIELVENRMQSFVLQSGDQNMDRTDVSELRAELFGNVNYQVHETLTSEVGITYESSRIDVSAQENSEQSLSFFKPRLKADWQFAEKQSLSAAAEHRVGQLDFSDFARSVDPLDARGQAGNTQLRPQQTTEVSAQYQWYFSKRSNLKVELLYQWRKDVLEHIAITDTSSAIGNAGDGEYWGSTIGIAIDLAPILDNALFEVSYEHTNSHYSHPNGRSERLSNYLDDWLWMQFRHDIPNLKSSWGLEYWGDYTEPVYYPYETLIVHGNKRLKGFIESSWIHRFKVRFEVTHMNTGRFRRERTFYEQAIISGYEVADRTHKADYRLSVWYNF